MRGGVDQICKGRESLASRVSCICQQLLCGRNVIVFEVRFTADFAEVTVWSGIGEAIRDERHRRQLAALGNVVHDLLAIDRQRQGLAHTFIIERLLATVEYDVVGAKVGENLSIA